MNIKVEHDDAGRILDVGQAHDAAVAEYVARNLAERKPHEYVDVLLGRSGMTGPAYSVDQGPGRDQYGEHERTGLPSPDAHAVAAHTATLNTRLELGQILVQHRNSLPFGDTAGAIDAILGVLGAAWTPWMQLTADQVERLLTDPDNAGVRVQVRDGKDEQTPHDVTSVLECEDDGHKRQWDIDCVVLVSSAWSEPNHSPADWDLTARVSAVTS